MGGDRRYSVGNPKAVILGWDGATWRLLEPWMDRGQLPNLRRMIREGVAAPLKSTIRPESSIAWVTFATGASPGQHGIFGFVRQLPGSYRTRMNTGSDVPIPCIWDVTGQAGLKVAVINVPMSYPPRPVNGFIVPGMPTPTPEPAAYPPELQTDLRKRFPKYRVQEEELGDSLPALLKELEITSHERADAILHYMDAADWDLFIGVLTVTDRLQHFFWHYLDPGHPRYETNEALKTRLLGIYAMLDSTLGNVMDIAEREGASLWLISDHGFNGCNRAFAPNLWLEQEGLLHRKATPTPSVFRADFLRKLRGMRFLRRLKQRLPGLRSFHAGRLAYRAPLADRIDWENTRAFFSEDGGIRINLHGREPYGVVLPGEYNALLGMLEKEVSDLKDPVTGISPIAQIFRKEELYRGPWADAAPDLVLEPRRSGLPENNTILLPGLPSLPSPFSGSGKYTGNHEVPGILVGWGEGIRSGKTLTSASLADVAPTVCYQLGLFCPPQADGRILKDSFVREFGPLAAARPQGFGDDNDQRSIGLSDEEEEKMRDHLRGLGYVE